jgi:asparagine synthase (glutamine-hydrolysing)
MTRWLAGLFDPRGRTASSRLATALKPHNFSLVTYGPLQLAYTGAETHKHTPLCLLDGFLDNAAQLAAELRLASETSPEELIAFGWRRWGRHLLPRMRGDFALLIWDSERDEGLLARDQLGIRSMFLHESSEGLRFACEIRHLLPLLPSRPEPDRASVAHWLAMSNRPGSATLFSGIRRLDPGAMLLLDRGGISEEHYWVPRYAEPLSESDADLALRVRTELNLAVHRRISPTGHTGVLMSGGLDSASVAASAATEAPAHVSAYSAVFPEHPLVDESALVDELRDTLKLPGITAEVRPGGLLASAVTAVRDWEMPLLGWGDFWTVPLLRGAAADGIQVTLGGDGGDELFGPRSYLMSDRLLAGHPREALALARELPGAGDHPAARDVTRIFARIALAGAAPYLLHEILSRPFARREIPRWMRPTVADELVDSDDPLAWKRMDGPRWWASTAYGLTRRVQEIGVFEHQRRRAAICGLEARHPMFDLDMVELGLRQPPQASFDRYRNRPVLRAAMAGALPASVRLRSAKAWFDSVIVDCLAGADGETTRRLLTDPNAEIGAYVDPLAVQTALFQGHARTSQGQFQWLWQVWRLLTAECWLRAQQDPGSSDLLGDLKPSPARVVLRHV